MVPNAGNLVKRAPFAAWQTGNQSTNMIISGVLVSATGVAVLALCLQRAGRTRLADDVGVALDGNWKELVLARGEEDEILSVLQDCPVELQPLRDALQANARGRA
jgi:hypothetical protein